jgi:hypothetical protein
MEANIYLLDNEIAQGLSQIRDAFGPYIEYFPQIFRGILKTIDLDLSI